MKKMVLIDGTNFIFRSFYATAVQGRLMRNSKGMATNGLFGFVNMVNKIITEEQADYYVVAFDEGKTFRHRMYDDYKGHRTSAPEELIEQLPYAKPILEGMGVKWLTAEDYEADDIVGSLAKQYCKEMEIVAISSDKDYLQLICDTVTVKLLKKSDFIYYDTNKLMEDFQLTPIQIVDLKALEGDKSDNIPGVKGVGEKTALKLIHEYGSLEGIYENIDNIKGKLQEKLITDKENAFFSKELAKIYTDLRFDLDDLEYLGIQDSLRTVYEELEFHSFLNKLDMQPKTEVKLDSSQKLRDVLVDNSIVYFDFYGTSLHNLELLGFSVVNDNGNFYFHEELTNEEIELLSNTKIRTFDYKQVYYYFYSKHRIEIECDFDFMLAFYLLDLKGNKLSDFSLLFGSSLLSDEVLYGKGAKYAKPSLEDLQKESVARSRFLFDIYQKVCERLKAMKLVELYYDIELPLSKVLANMEYNGICVDKSFLEEMNQSVNEKAGEIEKRVFDCVGYEFNINSYQQLGKALFEDLNIPYPKKLKAGTKYKTGAEILELLQDKYEVVRDVLEFRMLRKLSSTYLEGLQTHIKADGKIHTIYNQALTSTGRLSSIEPNLQNIPIRTDIGREIRKAFVASEGCEIVACDYSQIELRVLAELSKSKALISAFKSGIDIHTKTASEIYGIGVEEVNSTMRRNAKAVNFGIVYGMSDFGLSKSIDVSVKEAKLFIDKYFAVYDGIKEYLDQVITDATISGYSRTLFNRIRYIEELKSNNFMQRQLGERLAMNTPIQGTAADIIKIAMIKIDKILKEENLQSKMLLQVHDELIFDCVKSERERLVKVVVDAMKEAYYTEHIKNDFEVELAVDLGIGSTWFDAK